MTVDLAPAIPFLSQVTKVVVNGKPQKFSLTSSGTSVRMEAAPLILQTSQDLTVSIEFEGGIAIVPPPTTPEPGDRSSSLRVLDAQFDSDNHACPLKLSLAGLGGREYTLQLASRFPQLQAENFAVHKTALGFELRIQFEGSSFVTRDVCLTP